MPKPDVPRGMYLLKTLPVMPFVPQQFKRGSRNQLEKVVAGMKRAFPIGDRKFEVGPEWDAFALIAPPSDKVNDYLASIPLPCPLGAVLLGFENGSAVGSAQQEIQLSLSASGARGGDSVKWSGNLNPENPRIWIELPDEIQFSPVYDLAVMELMGVPELRLRISEVNELYGLVFL